MQVGKYVYSNISIYERNSDFESSFEKCSDSQDIFLKREIYFWGYLNDLTESAVEECLKEIKVPLKLPNGTKPQIKPRIAWRFPPPP